MSQRPASGAVGVVVALASEARTLTPQSVQTERSTPLGTGAMLWLSGMGPSAARRAAQGLADAGAQALAVFGVAGALNGQLRNGALHCPRQVLDEDGQVHAVDAGWHARLQRQLHGIGLPLHADGALLSVRAPLLTAADKSAAHARCAALAVDMESAAVAAVAHERGLPLLVLRAIVDEAGDAIPAALNDSVDAWGRPRTLGLLAALCRHPSVLADLPRLYSRMQRATLALRAAAKVAGPALAWPE
ncbi:purine and other phosphorylase-like protein, family 1 [Dyella acidiphila]|uniref:Purine and other phosphorylase-like protein, family 1 n=1 Tax=Dyella acidiphila TaxID=2775866 RepID=A0ABR9G5L6_9GAMM|nr:purine and other phosphorylase-like protein, family 1 [Dyella acidiphila]MBE1159346.1 purine and other phosphorylase-like protein, family 1 [Dyella acidiphila]